MQTHKCLLLAASGPSARGSFPRIPDIRIVPSAIQQLSHLGSEAFKGERLGD